MSEERAKDIYDEAVEYLTARPDMIGTSWSLGTFPSLAAERFSGARDTSLGALLFRIMAPRNLIDSGGDPGCLTQIRDDSRLSAVSEELTAKIRSDERIPKKHFKIMVDMLPIFAEYQRELDQILGIDAPGS